MAVIGIVAEYNPFHNGHLYLIKKAKHLAGSYPVVCVMSGNFLQRGEPAICNKWARAEMALKSGADLIIELPVCFSVRSAYYFARGALKLLQRSTVITHLAFGAECDNLLLLNSVAQLLADEPKALVNLIKDNLDMGKSFPQARADALHQYVGKDYEDIHDVLTGSNNILAIEYLRVIREGCIPFSPIIVKRKGSLYHDVSLSPFASATAIRHHLFTSPGLHHLNPSIPQATFNILERETAKGRCPVSLAPLERAILLKLRSLSLPKLRNIYEINEGLEFLFKEAANQSGTLDELIKTVKSKRYSLTRIKRTLLYILFNLTQEQILCFDQHGPLYLHILGFSSKGQKILQEIKNKSDLPIFSRGKGMKKARDKNPGTPIGEMINLEILASDIYTLLYPEPAERQGGKDFITSPIKV